MKPKVIKSTDKAAKDQRSQAVALIKSFPRNEQQQRRELTVQLGSSHFQIVIDKKVPV